MANKLVDFTGMKFGRWTVLGYEGRSSGNRPASLWRCRCDCGKEALVNGGNLRSGQSASCGCLRKELAASAPKAANRPRIDLMGQRFGRWMVTAKSRKVSHWECRCDCGVERVVSGSNLKRGLSESCGCLHKERASDGSLTHGLSGHPLYLCWQGIKNRCLNTNDGDFHHYGGRGITMCDRWNDVQAFVDDMEPTWRPGLTIERRDVNGNYDPDNCCWITQAEQTRNRRTSVFVDTPWGRMCLAEAARAAGISQTALDHRMRSGWPAERLFIPPRGAKLESTPRKRSLPS